MKKDFLKYIKNNVVLFDGGLGTEIYDKGFFINKSYDAVTLTSPDIIREIHQNYIDAGAEIIETNTFGANRDKLEKHGLEDKVEEINRKGAELALETAGEDVWVAGSVGPLEKRLEPLGDISEKEAFKIFRQQIKTLLDAGVDLLIFETFTDLNELRIAIKVAKQIKNIPVIAQMTINQDGKSFYGQTIEVITKTLDESEADVLGLNCTVGPRKMLPAVKKMVTLTNKPVSVMPNAGKPKNVDGRNIYLTSPEYLGEYAKHYVQSGAGIIGGCCGTSPEHIKRMRNMLNSLKPELKSKKYDIVEVHEKIEVEPTPQEKKSRLARRLKEGHFVKFVELLSPHGVSPEKQVEKARELFYYGMDVINIPDGPRASARMSALALAVLIQRDVGIETLLHYVCRDRNVIGMQSDLLGAYALGLKNILAITGDPPKLGNYPDATAVFDVDAIGLVNILNRLNHGLDIAGNPIGEPTGFFVGVGANPGAVNLDEEIRRLDWKVDAGAEYIITQPVFDLEIFEKFMKRIEHIDVPLIAGIWPLTSIRNAEFMNNEIPGCHVPDPIMERMRKYKDSKGDSRKEGIDVARETLEQLLGKIAGVQIAAPFGRIQSAMDVVEGLA